MKTFSCEVTLTPAEFEQFNRTMCDRRVGHDQLDKLLSTALSQKYTQEQLAMLSRAQPPAFLSVFFNLHQVHDVGDGTLIVTYAFDVPQRTRLVKRIFDEERDTGNLSEDDLVGYMVKFCPLDSRTGSTVRTIRHKHGTPEFTLTCPIGVSRDDMIRIVISSVPDER